MIIKSQPVNLMELTFEYPLSYELKHLRGVYNHEDMAAALAEDLERYRFHMFVVTSDHLDAKHFNDPLYIQREYHIGVCRAHEKVRRDWDCRSYFSDEEMKAFIKKHGYETVKYNYKEQPAGERLFIRELEDSIFAYQERVRMVEYMVSVLDDAKYVLDEDLYPVDPNEDGEYTLCLDKEVVEKQRKLLLEEYLAPQVYQDAKRVYNMPEPFNHWDARSFWHQFFFVEDLLTKETFYSRGHGGGSGTREANGRWVHTFGTLAKRYGVKIPTHRAIYDKDNLFWYTAFFPEFRCCRYDVTGNYHADYKEAEKLLSEFFIDVDRASYF